jgi:hypothetical protein
MSLFRVVIDIDCYRVKVIGRRQLHDKIYIYMLSRFCRNFLELKNSFKILWRLIALALLTIQDIFVYKQGHLRPSV